jgi:hypothetical protein
LEKRKKKDESGWVFRIKQIRKVIFTNKKTSTRKGILSDKGKKKLVSKIFSFPSLSFTVTTRILSREEFPRIIQGRKALLPRGQVIRSKMRRCRAIQAISLDK